MFAVASPPSTTLFHMSAMMKPKAAPRDVAIVFRTSAIESCLVSAIPYPYPRVRREPLGIEKFSVSLRYGLEAGGPPSPSEPHGPLQSGRSGIGRPGPSRATSPCPRL